MTPRNININSISGGIYIPYLNFSNCSKVSFLAVSILFLDPGSSQDSYVAFGLDIFERNV